MARVSSRLGRLEALTEAERPPCPLCAERPVFTLQARATVGEAPTACPQCGAEPLPFTITIDASAREEEVTDAAPA